MYREYVDEEDEEYQEFQRTQELYANEKVPDSNGKFATVTRNRVSPVPLLVSEYNDGKGIHYVISFQPQLPPLRPGEKRRSNARAEKMKCSIYLHEALSLGEVLEAIIGAIERNDQSMKFKIVGKQLCMSRFKIIWSITCTDYKDMELRNTDDFDEMVKQVLEKAKPVVALVVTELELETSAVS
jgi:hypothetical protein